MLAPSYSFVQFLLPLTFLRNFAALILAHTGGVLKFFCLLVELLKNQDVLQTPLYACPKLSVEYKYSFNNQTEIFGHNKTLTSITAHVSTVC